MKTQVIRVLIAKPGLDGHDRGAKIIARYLRDAGMEVIYTGLRQTPEQIVSAAIQEDVSAVGLSILSGAHNYLFPVIKELLNQNGMDDVLLFGGGTIPKEDIDVLEKKGIGKIFTPGSKLEDIERYLKSKVTIKSV
ncbi:MAG: methylmalonyl-CoA mutase [Nitrospinae bacterium]|nr:methylmalonyl-CoA mutase [Nitrospinota bacterium]